MRILEYLDAVAVLDDGSADVSAVAARLVAAGCAPVTVDLAAPGGWRAQLDPLLARPRRARATGVLVLSPSQGADRDLWVPQDRLVEQLECRDWDVAFLGHVAGAGCVPADERPGLVEWDGVPSGVSAIALRWRTFECAVELIPETAIDGPLSAVEWLTIVSWVAHSLSRASRPLFAWPPVLRAPPPIRGAAAPAP
jgi:hypothetical protein